MQMYRGMRDINMIKGLYNIAIPISPCMALSTALIKPQPGHFIPKRYTKGHFHKNTPW